MILRLGKTALVCATLVLAVAMSESQAGPAHPGSDQSLRQLKTRKCGQFKIPGAVVYEYRTVGVTCKRGRPLIKKWVRTGRYCSKPWKLTYYALTCGKGKKRIHFQVAFNGD